MAQNSALNSFVDFLFQPLPFIAPDSMLGRISFITRSGPQSRRARRRSANAQYRSGKVLRADARDTLVETGCIQRGENATFSINGRDFVINPDTWIFGEVCVGASASVMLIRKGQQLSAKKIVISS